MKIVRTMIVGLLFLFLNFAISSFAQQANRQDEAARPSQPQESNPPDAKPADPVPENPVHQEGKPPHEEVNRPPRDNKEKQADQDKQKQGKEEDNNKTQNRAGASGVEHGSRQSRQRIPEDKFRQHFGREHHFKVSQPVIVNNHPRIQYGGYFFEFVDPWPVEWSYSDECYIDLVDGDYFLFDSLHPGARIAVMVVL